MASRAGTLTLQQDQDLSPVRDNTQESIQHEFTQMRRMNIRIHNQALILHKVKSGKRYLNCNSTRTMCFVGPTGVTDFRVPISTQG